MNQDRLEDTLASKDWFPSLEADARTFGTIKAMFERVCSHVVFDAQMAQRVIEFQIAFVNKNEEHMAFFGGNLTGVQVVRFTPMDMDRFFTDVVQVNDMEIEEELHALSAIDPNRKVTSNVFNQTCVWVVHKFLTSNLPEPIKQRAAQSAALILLYRFLTSLLSHYYKTPADPQSAAAAYAQLSNKYAIKQHGSWHALLETRIKDLVDKAGLHHKTMIAYQDDLAINYVISDAQGRIRGMMKNLMGALKAAIASGNRHRATSATVELDGGESFLKDRTKSLSTYTRYLHSVIGDEHSFIKQDIIDILANTLHTAPPVLVVDTLRWCTINYRKSGAREVEELVDSIMVHSFGYLADNHTVLRDNNNLAGLILRLKGVYMSSRSTDVQLLKMRDLAEKITKKAIKSKNSSVVSAVKTALMLYLVVRAFTMSHYGAGR